MKNTNTELGTILSLSELEKASKFFKNAKDDSPLFLSATEIAKASDSLKNAKEVNSKLEAMGLIERPGKSFVPTDKAKNIKDLFITTGRFRTLKWNLLALKVEDSEPISYFNINRDHWEHGYYKKLGELEYIYSISKKEADKKALERHIKSNAPKFYRTKSGFKTRSKGEFMLATHLENLDIGYSYEYRADCLDNIVSDFYLEFKSIEDGKLFTRKIYIELWGLEDQPKYAKRKEEKIKLYKENGLTLVEFSDNVLSHDIESIFNLEFIRRFGKSLITMRNENWEILKNM